MTDTAQHQPTARPPIEAQLGDYARNLGWISVLNVASRYGTGRQQALEWLLSAEARGTIKRRPGAARMWEPAV